MEQTSSLSIEKRNLSSILDDTQKINFLQKNFFVKRIN